MSDVLCIIPARKGSKGIPHKNKQLLADVPLVIFSIRSALQAGIDGTRIVVSSDDEEILGYAKSWKVCPHRRPIELSMDESSTEDCMIDAIDNAHYSGDIKSVLLLQPTSPIRFKDRISDAITTYKNGDYDSLLSVTEMHPFFWNYQYDDKVKIESCVSSYAPNSRPRRQCISKYDIPYFENGNLYITDIDVLKNKHCRIGDKPYLYKISELEAMQIDDPEQLKIIDIILSTSMGRFFRMSFKHESENKV